MAFEDHLQLQQSDSKYECLLFDLDDTIYPLSSGLSVNVTKNIQEYMLQKLGIDEEKIPDLCVSLYKYYGTTMAGLKAIGYNFDPDDFHSFVHGRLPYTLLQPDPVLRSLLLSLPIRKVIFTNGDKVHAARVLSRMGLEDCFERIICFETINHPTDNANAEESAKNGTLNPETFDISVLNSTSDAANLQIPRNPVLCKPNAEAFEQVFRIANINPHKTLFFDDSIRNIQTGKRVGLHTVWVGNSQRIDGVDYALESIYNIREAFAELWEAEDKSEGIRYSENVAVETTVRA